MLKFAIIILAALVMFTGEGFAYSAIDDEPDCYVTAGEIECDSPGSVLGPMIGKALTWLCFVVFAPILVYRLTAGAIRETRMTDEEWLKEYPGKQLWERGQSKIGLGFVLSSAYLIAGVTFFWLLFVSPTTLKWMLGQ